MNAKFFTKCHLSTSPPQVFLHPPLLIRGGTGEMGVNKLGGGGKLGGGEGGWTKRGGGGGGGKVSYKVYQ